MITQVSVRNYKSLARVDVDLNPLTVLVGPNGSGKSNFVDALRFVTKAVSSGLDVEIAARGGINAIKCATDDEQNGEVSFDVRFQFEEGPGEFRFALGINKNGEYWIAHEEALIAKKGYSVKDDEFKVIGSEANSYSEVLQGLYSVYERSEANIGIRLFLSVGFIVSSIENIRRCLRDAGYYSIFPSPLREPQDPHSISKLMERGDNLNSVLQHLKEDAKEQFDQLRAALGKMVPGVADIIVEEVGGYLAVKLIYQYGDQTQGFYLAQESDGTLRLLGMLTALYQQPSPSLITIEEPELAVHPGALQTLYEVIKEASQRSQIIITTHSPDLIALCDPDDLRIVEKDESGATRIGRLDKNQLAVIQEMLFKSSDLLRIEGLRPESPVE